MRVHVFFRGLQVRAGARNFDILACLKTFDDHVLPGLRAYASDVTVHGVVYETCPPQVRAGIEARMRTFCINAKAERMQLPGFAAVVSEAIRTLRKVNGDDRVVFLRYDLAYKNNPIAWKNGTKIPADVITPFREIQFRYHPSLRIADCIFVVRARSLVAFADALHNYGVRSRAGSGAQRHMHDLYPHLEARGLNLAHLVDGVFESGTHSRRPSANNPLYVIASRPTFADRAAATIESRKLACTRRAPRVIDVQCAIHSPALPTPSPAPAPAPALAPASHLHAYHVHKAVLCASWRTKLI